MPTRIYWIHEFNNAAKIGIMARPRGGEWLDDEIVSFKKQQVDILVSLLERDEVADLGLDHEEAVCNEHGIRFLRFPIKDRCFPNENEKAQNFIAGVFNEVMSGLNVVVHCRMGIGRSSIIASAVIQLAGKKTDEIISKVIKLRGLKVPDTDEQLKWLIRQERN